MNRWRALIAIVLAVGLAVFVVTTASGSREPTASDTSTTQASDTATQPSETTTDPSADMATAAAVDAPPITAVDEGVQPASLPAPDVTEAELGQTEPAPDVTIDDRNRTEVEDAASELLAQILPAAADIDADETVDVIAQFTPIASRTILSELEAERLEFETLGWSREGSYVIDGVEVLSFDESGSSVSATVRVCLDSSDISVRGADGAVIETSPGSHRAWNIYVLERDSDIWRLVSRTFPDDPAC